MWDFKSTKIREQEDNGFLFSLFLSEKRDRFPIFWPHREFARDEASTGDQNISLPYC
jgi:hypothetical protein